MPLYMKHFWKQKSVYINFNIYYDDYNAHFYFISFHFQPHCVHAPNIYTMCTNNRNFCTYYYVCEDLDWQHSLAEATSG